MNSKMTNIQRKHRKAKLRFKRKAATSRAKAKAKTREKWMKTGLIPAYRY